MLQVLGDALPGDPEHALPCSPSFGEGPLKSLLEDYTIWDCASTSSGSRAAVFLAGRAELLGRHVPAVAGDVTGLNMALATCPVENTTDLRDVTSPSRRT